MERLVLTVSMLVGVFAVITLARDVCVGKSEDYRGKMAETINGATCQKWTSQAPYEHSWTPESYPDAGLGDHNYCRDPGGHGLPWCYTIGDTRWNWCFNECTPKPITELECVSSDHDSRGYRGKLDQTRNGVTCQKWSRQSPKSHSWYPERYSDAGLGDHNYCRDPGGHGLPWCYTIGSARWDWCFNYC